MRKKILLVLLLSMFVLSCLPVFAFADVIDARETDVDLRYQINKFDFEEDFSVRDLYDFSGNLYWLIEFEPYGYAIYHPIAKIFSEFSTTAVSPYLGFDDILYGGPSFYYVQEDNVYVNTQSGEEISIVNASQDEVTRSTSADQLTEIYNQFIVSANNPATRVADTVYLLPQAYYFQKLYSFGFNALGTCGQLAASIMLSYYANYVNVNFVPENYITPLSGPSTNFQSWTSMPALSDDLHQELIDITEELGLSLATTGSSIRTILAAYYEDHSIGGVTPSVLTSPFFIDTQMRNIINDNRPMLMFGNLTLPGGSKGNHAVVCYGYRVTSNVTYYKVHMGYTGYTSVELANQWSKNVFGQIYSITYSGYHVHSGNFIVNGIAYCGCGAVCN